MWGDSVFAESEIIQTELFEISNEQGTVSEFLPIISGISSYDSPFFSYRIESYNVDGVYSFGSWNFIQVDSITKTEGNNYWNWEISISENFEKCSCKIHVSQVGLNSEVIVSSVLLIWISNQAEDTSSLFPILVQNEHNNFVNDVFEGAVEIFYPFEDTKNDSISPQFTELTIEKDSEKIGEMNFSKSVNVTEIKLETGECYLYFSVNVSELPEDKYFLELTNELFSRWDITYFFEIDRTLPVPIIVAEEIIFESQEILIINASESYDPNGDVLEFNWIFENSEGIISVPTAEMLKSPSELIFLPIKSGNYTITIQISDRAGNTNELIHIIKVENVIPIAKINDSQRELNDGETYDYYSNNVSELFFSAIESYDSSNEIDELLFGWYLDGVLYSSENMTTIDLTNLENNVELELVVKDSDGASDKFSIFLNDLNVFDEGKKSTDVSNSNFLYALNLVLLTAFICILILMFIRKKSTEENPLPKWSKHNRQQ